MPQDSLRSAVYRSFVTCDDPKGVVECGTIRKSKSKPKRLENKVESQKMPKNSESSSEYKEERKEKASKSISEGLHIPSSFQLMEVSKGAHKLNRMIDSWSKGSDGHSEELAKDLLKGALDLQDSLIMLGKLQKASQYMTKLKKKQKEKFNQERIDGLGFQRTNSRSLVDQNYQVEFQKSRLSADGSSRDCFEELRTAIRDGLAKQNLLPPNFTEKNACSDRRTLDSASDIASTSSSQSSMVNFHSLFSSDSSLSSKAPHKSKGSNLIAKLMGLEEFPLQEAQTGPCKQLESEKISSQKRPMFEVDMPKARKPHSASYKVYTEQRKLKEIVETMHFKGLLKCSSPEAFRHSNASKSRKQFTEDSPPIVLIKPLRVSRGEVEDNHLQKFMHDAGALQVRKFKIKEPQPRTTDQREGALNSSEMSGRLEGEETGTPIKRVTHKRYKNLKGEEKAELVKRNEKLSSSKLKDCVPANQQQRKKAVEKKVDRTQKETAHRKKPSEVEHVKSKVAPKSHDQAKVASTKERKPEIGLNITKNRITQRKTISASVISKHKTTAISHDYGGVKKSVKVEKQVKEPLAVTLVVEDVGGKHGNEGFNHSCEEECDMTSTITTEDQDQLFTEEGTDPSDLQIKDQFDCSQNAMCNVTPETEQPKSDVKLAEETNYCSSHNSTKEKWFRTEANEKDLFLSSPSFLSTAQELFNVDTNQAILLQTSSQYDCVDDTRLLLDCANELLQRKRRQCTETKRPSLTALARNFNISISLSHLVDEVYNGIENLRSYSKNDAEKLPSDNVNAVLEKDLKSEGAVSGGWDWGWRHEFTVQEVEQVVGDIEKLVFNVLIENLLTDFLL
ncbi:uncharacterized protein LOC127806500 [Diospyros lotus]|uniref:uncharacterized protein LOC127806500 n=1 Tax=Diospyros lotus TaxID=55363 RepID=UPI002251038E|nr:uncharacterized protein LOC127806500 [Diospyros lotus]XP_052199804.1 uncharacterized protein LOC127806500 [Diospyros lotus]XP_052199805.1 uncharacterized protein LOC127806500 [Diospyros lotus]XP_052199806.1 uncharacterized protein LOC127806500 [Diospyros lotus]XP_052199807.1 uncharacterized protein LOC127806500 [Diospyros lotus]XP_052199808.1 uncharacterized protein LOC127806500 [Diospyros lotus]